MERTSNFSMTPPEDGSGDRLIVGGRPPEVDVMLPALATTAAKMTKQDAIEACREAGMMTIDVGKWEGYSKIGQYLQELGAVKVAAGQYAYHNQLRKKVIRLCRKAMGKAESPEHVAKLAEVMGKLLDSSDATIKELLKFVHTGVIKEPEERPSIALPPRGTPVVAVKIENNMGENPSTK